MLEQMEGRHFCVSFAHPEDIDVVMRIGQSVMLDNGAFTAFTKGREMDVPGFVAWANQYASHPHWAVIPDVIDGSVEEQRNRIAQWPLPKDISAPVWHLGLPIDWLLELADNYPRICLGSSGAYWQVGSLMWQQRMDEAFEALTKTRRFLPWIHGMRMLGQAGGRWPLASADSTNVARNHKRNGEHPELMAWRIDRINPEKAWTPSKQGVLI